MLNDFYTRCITRFANFGNTYFKNYLHPLKYAFEHSDINMLYESYIGKMFFYSFFISIILFFYYFAMLFLLAKFTLYFSFILSFFITIITYFIILTAFHAYPLHLLTKKKKEIEDNLSFAINHMAVVAASGASPSLMFKLVKDVEEFGEISKIAEKIIRNIEIFGMDLITAIKSVAMRTPSEKFRHFLYGVISTLEGGGSIQRFLEKEAKNALADYELKRQRYLSLLSTYADFYTIILIAAPLFFISILSVMSLIGGTLAGLDIGITMRFGIYLLIPLMNIGFILFIHYTQPKV